MQEHLVFFANTILFAEAVVVRRSFLAAALARAWLVQISSTIEKTNTEETDITNTLVFLANDRRLSLFAVRAWPLRWPAPASYRSALV